MRFPWQWERHSSIVRACCCGLPFGGKLRLMMGQHARSESLFYYFRLEDQVPENHLLRLIDTHIDFSFVREQQLFDKLALAADAIQIADQHNSQQQLPTNMSSSMTYPTESRSRNRSCRFPSRILELHGTPPAPAQARTFMWAVAVWMPCMSFPTAARAVSGYRRTWLQFKATSFLGSSWDITALE